MLFGLAAQASTQARGVHRGLFVAGDNLSHGVSWMLHLDASNQPTTLRSQYGKPGAPWTTWGNAYGMTMDADNQTVIVPGIVGTTLNPLVLALVRYDPMHKAVVGTLWQGVASPATLTNWSNLTLNSDGDVITIDNGNQPDSVAEYDVFARAWRHVALPKLLRWHGIGIGAGVGGCEWSAFGGGIHHVTWYGTTVVPGYIYHTSHDYRVTRTLTPVPKASVANQVVRFGGSLLESQHWASSVWCNVTNSTCSFYWLADCRVGGLWKWNTVGTSTIPWDVTHEKYAAPGRGLWIANAWPREIRYTDVDQNTITTVFAGDATTMPGLPLEVLPLYDRDLGTRRTGKATWDLYINPGAGSFALKSYIIAASLMPPRPGATLPDGRNIFIGFDFLTGLTASAPFAPFFTGNIGNLDAKGRATAKIDLALFGDQANGTVVHFCGLVLDPQAPSGIAWVTDPHAFVVDVIP